MKENKIIVVTMILNLFVAIIKLVTGVIFSFSTLIADSVQSFMDFITDITSLVANKIGKRRANKTFPFGYGQVYSIANLFTGALLFLIGIFILYQFFFFNGEFRPTPVLFVALAVVLLLKGLAIWLLQHFGTNFKSELMIEASKESAADFVSTCVVLAVSILALIESYLPEFINIDKIGSLGMAIYVFYMSIKMIVANIQGMMTKAEENEEIKEDVAKEIEKYKGIEVDKLKVIKMSTYYSVFMKLSVADKMTIKKYIDIEKDIKKHLKNKNRSIRFIDIEPVSKKKKKKKRII